MEKKGELIIKFAKMPKQKTGSLLDYYGFTKAEQRKYSVISGILRELTPERIKREVEEVKNTQLPEELEEWVREYEKAGGKRNMLFWQWIYKAIQDTVFSTVEKRYLQSIQINNFLFIIYIILLDDLVDGKGSKNLIIKLLEIPILSGHINNKKLKNKKEKIYLKFAIKIWKRINIKFAEYPRYKEFKQILNYDIKQIINAMEYDNLVNRDHYLINKREYWLYAPNTMQIVFEATLNLMCMPSFKINELGFFREAILGVQKMARIANWLCTWERELKEDDYTSGIFANAIELGIISCDDLKKENYLKIIRKINEAKIEKDILKDWEKYYIQIQKTKNRIISVNAEELLFSAKKLLIMYFTTKGKI